MSVVKLENVSKVFRRGFLFSKTLIHAVSNVSLDIHEGEILALVGESGCGKTTLGKIVAGLIKPTSGRVLWMGKDIWSISKKEFKKLRPLVQIVHQDPYSSFNPVKTIYDTLATPIKYYGLAKDPKKVRKLVKELLSMAGIEPPDYFMNKYPHHLSGGMRQRLSIIRASIPKPKLIVADEPVSMIDVSLRLSVLDLMKRLNRELNTAFLYITHDIATARYFVHDGRMMIMYLGEIVELGSAQELIENPLHPYLRLLLTSLPIPNPKIARMKKRFSLRSLEPPSPISPPPGCKFHIRCPYAKRICEEKAPKLRPFNGHMVACHLVEELPEWKAPWIQV